MQLLFLEENMQTGSGFRHCKICLKSATNKWVVWSCYLSGVELARRLKRKATRDGLSIDACMRAACDTSAVCHWPYQAPLDNHRAQVSTTRECPVHINYSQTGFSKRVAHICFLLITCIMHMHIIILWFEPPIKLGCRWVRSTSYRFQMLIFVKKKSLKQTCLARRDHHACPSSEYEAYAYCY